MLCQRSRLDAEDAELAAIWFKSCKQFSEIFYKKTGPGTGIRCHSYLCTRRLCWSPFPQLKISENSLQLLNHTTVSSETLASSPNG
ncbi:unnamed protein product [Ixodes pacificus]